MKIIFGVLALCFFPTLGFGAESNGLKNESELGMVLTGGNTDITTISLKQSDLYVSERNSYKFFTNYLHSSDSGLESALTWGLGLRYERSLSERWSLFLGQLLESNKFQGILQRYATDIGGKYIVRDEETFKWSGEVGYRFARENYSNGFGQNLHFVRLYSEAQYLFSPKTIAKLWVELLPNLIKADEFQFNAELSLLAVLSDLFSIKSAFLLKFNNEPPLVTASKSDTTFTTSLVAKF